ncbi:hypothetical protein F01_480256 [Burkholderia cenocepacia]|nr:hypothetical protein F01_480256 [Burkholderia cenocepacia]
MARPASVPRPARLRRASRHAARRDLACRTGRARAANRRDARRHAAGRCRRPFGRRRDRDAVRACAPRTRAAHRQRRRQFHARRCVLVRIGRAHDARRSRRDARRPARGAARLAARRDQRTVAESARRRTPLARASAGIDAARDGPLGGRDYRRRGLPAGARASVRASSGLADRRRTLARGLARARIRARPLRRLRHDRRLRPPDRGRAARCVARRPRAHRMQAGRLTTRRIHRNMVERRGC